MILTSLFEIDKCCHIRIVNVPAKAYLLEMFGENETLSFVFLNWKFPVSVVIEMLRVKANYIKKLFLNLNWEHFWN